MASPWYQTAVFYEALVRSFRDSNGDGFGDLRGAIDRLDYLQWLGIDCLWLPPGCEHGVKPVGGQTLRFVVVTAPPPWDTFAIRLRAITPE